MPLHKIPLCSFKYVGDVHSSGTFIYKQEEYISKTKEMFLKSQEKKYIDIEKNKDLNRESNISLYKQQVIPIVLYRQIKINKTINKLLENVMKNNLIAKDYVLLNKFKLWNINKNTSKIIQKYQNIDIKNIGKIYNLNNNNKQIYLDNKRAFLFHSDKHIFIENDNIFTCSKYREIQNSYSNLLLDSKYRNMIKDNEKYNLNKYKVKIDVINNRILSLDKYKSYIYKNNHKNELDRYKIQADIINYSSLFLNRYKTNIYKDVNEQFINRYKVELYTNSHIDFFTSYKTNIYINKNIESLSNSYKNINKINDTFYCRKKLEEINIILNNKIISKEIDNKSNGIYLINNINYLNKSKNSIYLNSKNNCLDLTFKKLFKINKGESLIKTHSIIQYYEDVLLLNKYKNSIILNSNIFTEKSKKELNILDNIFIDKSYSNIDKSNYLCLDKSFTNIIKNESDLLEKMFINKQFYKKDGLWLTKKKGIKDINIINVMKNITISCKDINNIKTYKELINPNKGLNVFVTKKLKKKNKEIYNSDNIFIEHTKKDLNKTNNILLNKKKKNINSHRNKILLNKKFKFVTVQNKNKLIGKTYIKTNKDINGKNIKRIKPNNINKKENVLLKHIYINEMCNVKYDSLLEKVMPVAEVFKQDNVFLDKNIMSYTIVKEKGNLLQHVYSNSIFKGTLSMLSHVKNIEMVKETSNHLIKKHKLLNKTCNKSLEKGKTTIHKNKDNFLEVTERWWVLNPTSPFDRKILPFDYDYSKMPLVSNNNIIKTSKVINQHPISFAPYMIDGNNGGKDLDFGTKEIDVSIEIMLDMVNIVGMIVLQDVSKFKNCTGQEALEFILELIFDWLSMDSTIRKMEQNNSREHYLRGYRWIRWEAEQLWFEADENHTIYKNLGIKFAGALLGKLIEYMKYHHFDIVPFWRNLRFMDVERQFNKAKNKDIFKDVDKIKSHRHYMLNTQIQTKQHLFQK
ncbi:hypothetical protein QB607_003293 [Clostridium botulinum]|nr:hypothetical protein [Clostridium botulinum]EKS4395965.1 hypothetical protein [Clostridium botulinum]